MTPVFQKLQSPDRILNQVQNNIAVTLNPLTSVPLNSGFLLTSVSLVSGTNSINHRLGRNLVGWFTTRIRGAAVSLFDTQDQNLTPSLTLDLTSSAPVVVDLFVF